MNIFRNLKYSVINVNIKDNLSNKYSQTTFFRKSLNPDPVENVLQYKVAQE